MRPLFWGCLLVLGILAGKLSPSRATLPRPADDPIALARQATGLELAPDIETLPGGQIDWSRGFVTAIGIGKARADLRGRQAEAMAKRGAYIVAARNVALVLAGVRAGPGGRFENVRNGWIRADVKLTGLRELDAEYDPATRTATARLELPLTGAQGVVSVLGLQTQPAGTSWRWPDVQPSRPAVDVLLFDARGLSCRPSVLPRWVTEDGRCVFRSVLRAGEPLRRPVARYVTLDRKTPLPKQPRCETAQSLVVRPVRIHTDGAFVLAPADLDRLAQTPNAKTLMNEGKIVVVTDP